MHIGIVSPCSSGPLADLLPGSEALDLGCGVHFMTTLVRALIERGHRISVVTLSAELAHPRILTGPNLTYYVYPMRTQRRMRDLYKMEREGLRTGIRSASPDVLHAHWTYEFAMACLEMGLPTLVTSHDNAFQQLRFSRDLFRVGQLYIQIRVIRKSRSLTAVSPYLADSLHWLAKGEIQVIPNPVQLPQKTERICDRLHVPIKIATVLNGWGRRKNPKAAIKAVNILRHKVPDAELFMYGQDFEESGPASQWAASNRLSQNIHFCGFRAPHDLRKQLREMSLLLHPALEEACPMALIEAMALGLPIVAGRDAGGVPWVLDQGRAGFLTDITNPKKIAECLFTCIERPQLRQQKQKNAYERVERLFSPDGVAEQYEQAYERVLI